MIKNDGFLIIELVIYLFITSIITVLLFNIFKFSINTFSKTEANVEIQQQAQFLKELIEDRVQRSKGIDSIINVNGQRVNVRNFKKGQIREIRLAQNDGLVGIYIDSKSKKMFLRTDMNYNGYEIGNYVNKMEIENVENGKGITFILQIQKKDEIFDLEFTSYFRNN
ncbi:hypothetical protein SAMN05661008_01281 [Alkalithermobacter thermoalcaliphilus JW-YL-7 = DSM 7308]|uniref:Uncharacterized protein n=1 Tax=Alkalithermobacter thermoalcaliphilus JW-YL-7 = DSM 7308 TaxID=1121328 RepID=A0A150FR53_CLOPD|nr:hypothetical protein JWYL7_1151 [[Clostridium] paradoxum JW-YL-7 = DSM 7308]SHL00724.1 hypothetical protein SAMN05661008_01281 [[Clostridium] paradoxum JW-YL-7 = DSM 7308]